VSSDAYNIVTLERETDAPDGENGVYYYGNPENPPYITMEFE
jgi:hypothetical protein